MFVDPAVTLCQQLSGMAVAIGELSFSMWT